MLTALCKMIPNSKAHSQKDLNSIYTLSTPASKGVENIDALLDTGSTKGVSKPLHPFKAKHRCGAGRIPANVIPFLDSVVMATTVHRVRRKSSNVAICDFKKAQ